MFEDLSFKIIHTVHLVNDKLNERNIIMNLIMKLFRLSILLFRKLVLVDNSNESTDPKASYSLSCYESCKTQDKD